jgi:hypothetical protein
MKILSAFLVMLLLSGCSPTAIVTTTIPTTTPAILPVNADNVAASIQPSVETASPISSEFSFVLTSPQNNEEVTTSTIDLIGVISEDAVMSVNDDIYILQAGDFKQSVPLVEGSNVLEIVVSDTSGNEIDQIVTVYYEPVQE